MKNLTKSDLINIDTFKGLLKMLSNDIKEAKGSNAAPEVKAQNVFKLSVQRSQLINNAASNYPQINWIDETIGPKFKYSRAVSFFRRHDACIKLKIN